MPKSAKQKPAGPATRTIRRTITEEITEYDDAAVDETETAPSDDEDGDDASDDDEE